MASKKASSRGPKAPAPCVTSLATTKRERPHGASGVTMRNFHPTIPTAERWGRVGEEGGGGISTRGVPNAPFASENTSSMAFIFRGGAPEDDQSVSKTASNSCTATVHCWFSTPPVECHHTQELRG